MGFNVGFQEFFYTNSGDPVTTWPTSGTTVSWTVPEGVYWVWVKAIAGGGGGGSSIKYFAITSGAGGGGAGESVEGVIIPTTPGSSLSIYVGGGGYYGQRTSATTIYSYNVHAGPENYGKDAAGNRAINAGWGGEKTVVGPIELKGGYGGLGSDVNNHGGMGGGPQAGPKGHNSGAGLSNQGEVIGGASSPGYYSTVKDCGRFWAGSGGGGAANTGSGTTGSGTGGNQGPFDGGAEGASTGTVPTRTSGGAGGGASVFGPGGDGGAADNNAPAVPSGSYGAGGGGAGGCSTTSGSTTQGFLGARGGHGYVSLHYLIVTPAQYVLSTQTGSFTLTGNAVTFTYP